jgi:hypothetical protein
MTLKELRAVVDSIEQADEAQIAIRYTDSMGAPAECAMKEILLESGLTSEGAKPQRILLIADK